ncbi:hypothetical protein [Sinorhizobium sp. BG8]|uniref:hypothetical protein n=1 Tax=Sinorhizobium sp. BG8 TaxID=2613773 RepID=UPI00193E47B8|nr:hypothetical protein [Sinorhizobium sp. BG8]QRM54065.1 hypothetical protein F3Y30_05495 [Sinorhizobium sp. BG8]
MTDFSFANLSRYFIEVEWVLTWFPIRDEAVINRPIMRNGTINHRSDDFGPGIGGGAGAVYWLGEAEGLPPAGLANGFAEIYGDLDHRLSVSLEIKLGGMRSSHRVAAPPGQRLPFMLNIAQGGQDADGTALTLFGTIVTSEQLGLRLVATER